MNPSDIPVSMQKTIPEHTQIKVPGFTRQLFAAEKPVTPFTPITTTQVLADLSESRAQIREGKGLPMEDTLQELGKQHGFI